MDSGTHVLIDPVSLDALDTVDEIDPVDCIPTSSDPADYWTGQASPPRTLTQGDAGEGVDLVLQSPPVGRTTIEDTEMFSGSPMAYTIARAISSGESMMAPSP